jgi:hypothetical protein
MRNSEQEKSKEEVAAEVFNDVTTQSKLLTDWEETEHGIRANINSDAGRIQVDYWFQDDGMVTERLSIIDTEGDDVLTESQNYGWEEVQRHFIRVALQDLTDRADNSRRVRLTESEASALTTVGEIVVEELGEELSEDGVHDIRSACDRFREAFDAEANVDRLERGSDVV